MRPSEARQAAAERLIGQMVLAWSDFEAEVLQEAKTTMVIAAMSGMPDSTFPAYKVNDQGALDVGPRYKDRTSFLRKLFNALGASQSLARQLDITLQKAGRLKNIRDDLGHATVLICPFDDCAPTCPDIRVRSLSFDKPLNHMASGNEVTSYSFDLNWLSDQVSETRWARGMLIHLCFQLRSRFPRPTTVGR